MLLLLLLLLLLRCLAAEHLATDIDSQRLGWWVGFVVSARTIRCCRV